MKDYINVYDEFNNSEKMELVCTFKLSNYNFNYIIYKTLDNKDYYISKYEGNSIASLNNNLNAEELKLANKILEGVINNA